MGDLLYYIIVGAIAGWLANLIMKGRGHGLFINIILGIIGGLFGGWIFGKLGINLGTDMLGEVITAVFGAIVLIFIARQLKK